MDAPIAQAIDWSKSIRTPAPCSLAGNWAAGILMIPVSVMHYWSDWVLSFVLFALGVVLNAQEPYTGREILGTEAAYSYFESDTVSTAELFIYILAVAAIVLIAGQLKALDPMDAHSGMLGLLEAVAITFLFSEWIKYYTGRPRPNKMAADVAKGGADENWDGLRSFPSGHSSLSHSVCWFCTMYLLGKSEVMAGSGAATWQLVVALMPMWLAAYIACSRTRDYRHNFGDIVAGALIGILVATVTYLHHFFPPWDSGRSFSPRKRWAELPNSLPSSTLRSVCYPLSFIFFIPICLLCICLILLIIILLVTLVL